MAEKEELKLSENHEKAKLIDTHVGIGLTEGSGDNMSQT